jgi:hypothetical protein
MAQCPNCNAQVGCGCNLIKTGDKTYCKMCKPSASAPSAPSTPQPNTGLSTQLGSNPSDVKIRVQRIFR